VFFNGKEFESIENWGPNIIILTPVTPLTNDQMAHLLYAIFKTKVTGYDFFSAIRSWLWKSTDDEKPNGRRYHCSEFVSAMYRKGLGIDLVEGRSDDTTQPQDFLTSPHLRIIDELQTEEQTNLGYRQTYLDPP
jgi:hypothetical protein